MNRTVIAIGLALATTLSVAAATAAELTITTGGPKGTYKKFGNDIKLIAENFGIELSVRESRGSVENLRRLLGYEGASDGVFYQLGLVQADVLQELRDQAAGNETLRDIVDKIQVVLPLYGEEVHVFAPLDTPYGDFDELIRNAFLIGGGKAKSGTLHTSSTLVRLLGAEAATVEITEIGGDNALDGVKKGEVEAFIDVAGAPSNFASNISPDENLKLLPITGGEALDGPNSPYRDAVISPSTYGWIDREVQTVAVNSLLVAYAYDPRNEHCAKIEKLTRAIIKSIDFLRREGHAKWRDFNLRAARERTDLYECARRGLFDD